MTGETTDQNREEDLDLRDALSEAYDNLLEDDNITDDGSEKESTDTDSDEIGDDLEDVTDNKEEDSEETTAEDDDSSQEDEDKDSDEDTEGLTEKLTSQEMFDKYGIKPHIGPDGQEKPIDLQVPPSTLRKSVKDEWGNLPEHVRAEIYRRESDAAHGIQQLKSQYSQTDEYARTISQEFEPYNATIKSLGSNHQNVIRNALATMHKLTAGSPEQKLNEIISIADAYNVPLEKVVEGTQQKANNQGSQAQRTNDPKVAELEQRYNQLAQYVSQREQQEQQQLQQQGQQLAAEAHKELAQFEQEAELINEPIGGHNQQGQPLTVRDQMATLIESGQASSFQEAYDKAVWMNPATREQLTAKQQEESKQRSRGREAEKAASAKKASSTNAPRRGKPAARGSEKAPKKKPLRQELSATFDSVMDDFGAE